jgi:hypothetical protein
MSTTVTPWELYKPDGGLVISEAEGMRSRGWGKVLKGAGKMVAGTPVTGTTTLTPVAAAGEAGVTGLLLYSIDTTNADVEVAVLRRDCEVNEGYLILDGLAGPALITALTALGIIVRPSVLDGPGGTYAGGGRATDPALANTPYGPGGNASALTYEAEATPGNAPSQPPAQTDQPPPGA